MATVAKAKPSSHFATLLRRSKFATFDPKIGQVYYSCDGDAHRGNFGLKRPLPLRRRMAHIVVSAVDSKEQQTEWRNADNDARWMKMWEEVGVTPQKGDGSPWSARFDGTSGWDIDSEFAPRHHGEKLLSKSLGKQSNAVPNVDAMTPKQFEAYLARLRELRPAFQQYLKDIAVGSSSQSTPPRSVQTNVWAYAKNPGDEHTKFLKHHAYKQYYSAESRAIEQQPSITAGLAYTKMSLLQSFLYTKSHRGRILSHGQAGELLVGYAGTNAHIPFELKGTSKPVDWNTLAISGIYKPDEGNSKFRIVKATLRDVPNVVGAKPQGLEGVRMDTYILDESNHQKKFYQWSKRRLGSKEYVSEEVRQETEHIAPITRGGQSRGDAKPSSPRDPAKTRVVLSLLANLLSSSQT